MVLDESTFQPMVELVLHIPLEPIQDCSAFLGKEEYYTFLANEFINIIETLKENDVK